jgi:CBS domain-containing protein
MSKVRMPDLENARVRDVMQKDLLLLSADDPIAEAVSAFEEYHITGAPVVDGAGKPVGVLTISDLTRDDHMQQGRLAAERYEFDMASSLDDEVDDRLSGDEAIRFKEGYSAELLGQHRVRDWMTPRVVSVDQDSLLPAACRVMAREGIHRVLVTEESSVIGILSAFDVVRFLGGEA